MGHLVIAFVVGFLMGAVCMAAVMIYESRKRDSL